MRQLDSHFVALDAEARKRWAVHFAQALPVDLFQRQMRQPFTKRLFVREVRIQRPFFRVQVDRSCHIGLR